MVGNSLSEDSGANTVAMQWLAYDTGIAFEMGYHIWHSHDLAQIFATPGTFDEAFPSEWDVALPAIPRSYFTFQPYLSSTLDSQDTAVQNMVSVINSGSKNPKYFLLEGWPNNTQIAGNYSSFWNGGGVSTGATAYNSQLANMTYMYAQLHAVYGSKLYVIPTGDVMNSVDAASRAGQFTGASTLSDWYRDGIHMGDAGRFVASCTLVATVLQKPCVVTAATVAKYIGDNGTSTVTLTTAMASQISTLVWNVVSTDSRAIH